MWLRTVPLQHTFLLLSGRSYTCEHFLTRRKQMHYRLQPVLRADTLLWCERRVSRELVFIKNEWLALWTNPHIQ